MASPETKTQTTETQNVLDGLKLDGKLTSKEKQKLNEMALNPKNKEALQKSLGEIKIGEKILVDYLKTNDAKADGLKPEQIGLVQLFLKLDGKYEGKIDGKFGPKTSKGWGEYKTASVAPKAPEKVAPKVEELDLGKVELSAESKKELSGHKQIKVNVSSKGLAIESTNPEKPFSDKLSTELSKYFVGKKLENGEHTFNIKPVEKKPEAATVAPVKVEKAPETPDLFGSVDLDKFTKRQFRELYESRGIDGFKKLAKLDPSDAERVGHPAISSEYGITTFDSSHILSAKKIMKLYDADKSSTEVKNKSLEKFLGANAPKVVAVEKAPEQDKNKELVDRLSKIGSKGLSMEDLGIKYDKKTGYSIEGKDLKSESIQKWLGGFTYVGDFKESDTVTVSNIKMDSKGVLNMKFNKSYKNEDFSISPADDKDRYARLMDAPQVSDVAFKGFVKDKMIASISKLEGPKTPAKPFKNPDTGAEMTPKSADSKPEMPASKAAAPEKKVAAKTSVVEKDLKS